MIKLTLLRHGESVWNRENRFTGWTDVDLSETGIAEAAEAARLMKDAGLDFDLCYASYLKRAIRTLWIALDGLDRMWLPVKNDWRLNERHYGALQGLNKAETAAKYGEDKVFAWRRSYDTPPPPLEPSDPRHPSNDPRYAALEPDEAPSGESLALTVKRVLPCCYADVAPAILSGKRVLVAAHGNSLRALVKYLDKMSDDAVAGLNIPTGVPLVYELDEETLAPLNSYYLGDPAAVAAKAAAVAAQGAAQAKAKQA